MTVKNHRYTITAAIKYFTSVFSKYKTPLSSRCDGAQRGESDIPPDRGELKGVKLMSFQIVQPFYLPIYSSSWSCINAESVKIHFKDFIDVCRVNRFMLR